MRKFRVWCKNKKEWEKHSCYLNQNGFLSHSDNNMQIRPLNPETHIVEFFTGLQDKNGKDIYEGDITLLGKVKRVVEYRDGKFIDWHNECEIISNIHEDE